jgi:hypothetical protein
MLCCHVSSILLPARQTYRGAETRQGSPFLPSTGVTGRELILVSLTVGFPLYYLTYLFDIDTILNRIKDAFDLSILQQTSSLSTTPAAANEFAGVGVSGADADFFGNAAWITAA